MTRLVGLFATMMVLSQVEAHDGIIRTRVWDEKSQYGSYLCSPSSGQMLDGCSWYCVGVEPKVTASSQFGGQRNRKYAPDKAHDFNSKTAWLEGKRGYGIGEFLEYAFLLDRDRQPDRVSIDGLIIVDGYRKSMSMWRAYSRVKTLRMYVDGKEFGTVRLKDTPNVQTAKLPVIKLTPGRAKVLRFEIVEVYRGSKYRNTAISELLVDGPSGH